MNNDCKSKTGQEIIRSHVIESLVSGSLSSIVTTTIYQPLDLLKTRIQLRDTQALSSPDYRIFGRTTQSATSLIRNHNVMYLWSGTGPSLLRSVPGVSLYYATLSILQINLSGQNNKPDNPAQAFIFGLVARSVVSFMLLPVTVIKVRYESGQYRYTSLASAVTHAYLKNGWVGVTPTILRDSLFSGIYYMCYTKLKSCNYEADSPTIESLCRKSNFGFGILSGLIASILTNPLDVLKTNIQVNESKIKSIKQASSKLLAEKHGYMRFFDGMVPRSLRRALIAATTWTFYEMLMDSFNSRK